MKKIVVSVALIIMIITACSPQAQPTDIGSDVEEDATQTSENLTSTQIAVVSKVASNLGIATEQVKLISSEAMEWPDSCLGIEREGISCAEVITAGQRILLDANGRQVEYRTNKDGSVVLPATVALIWSRVGGIAGFCDSLTIFLSGEAQATNCNSSEMIERPLNEVVSPEQMDLMNEWISKYAVVDIDASDPQGVADGMSIKLQLMGQGTEQLTSPAARQILLQFVQELNNQLMNP